MGIFNFMAGRKLQNAELNGMLGDDKRLGGFAGGILGTAATLDALDARVIVIDAQHTMVLINTAARQMFMHAEVEMRKQIPGFNADRLTGGKVDIFFRNPSQQREVFESMLSTQRDRLQFGMRSFDIVMTPVFGDEQVRLGTVIEWRDAVERPRKDKDDTEKQALDRKVFSDNARVRAAVDRLGARVMIADNDNVIVYANEAVLNMLADAERDIRRDQPDFNARAVVGKPIDVFHRSGGHQRQMVGALQGAHKTDITVGGRKLHLNINSVVDQEGKRLGSVVEWNDLREETIVLDGVQKTIDAALAGDLSARIDASKQTGLSASMSGSINKLLISFESVIDEVKEVMSCLATGNLKRKITRDYHGSYDKLKTDINTTVDKMVEVVTAIRETAEKVKVGSAEITSGNLNLSQRTEEQAASLEETSAAMEEITTTVQQNAANAVQANTLARGARETAENGGNVVGRAISAMQAISDSSKKINDIIGVIDEIAFQTNLLALNAAVEAARAGDQGRGFAVVADEVRNLAGRSATAAKEIKDLIKDSGTKVQEGASLVNKSGETLDEIVTAVKKVNDIVAEIATASDEQATGLNEINRAVGEMDTMTQQNAALVEEAASASESLGNQADTLESLLDFFDTGVKAVVRHEYAKPAARKPADKKLADRRTPERRAFDNKKALERRPAPAVAAKAGQKPAARLSKAVDSDENNWSEF